MLNHITLFRIMHHTKRHVIIADNCMSHFGSGKTNINSISEIFLKKMTIITRFSEI